MSVPTIAHADAHVNERGRVVITMNEGYSFYDRAAYNGFIDENGNSREPLPDEISYSKYGVFSPDTDFDNRFVIVADEDISKETSSDEATEADYINALEDLGVTFNE